MSIVYTLLMTAFVVSFGHCEPILWQRLSANSSNDYRLPTDIVPLSYNITLIPDMEAENFTFQGESDIELKFADTKSEIVFHFKDLELQPGISILCTPRYYSNDSTYTKGDGILTIVPGEPIQSGSKCKLNLKFSGKDNGENRGFYRTSYIDKFGKKKFMASTQFEPISARQVFPCWDEPAIKATFNISIKHNRKYTALSNMPSSISSVPENISTVLTTFGPSPLMSSYSVAFAIGDFAPVDEDQYDFQVWSRKEVASQGKYARKIGPIILEAMENYTQYPYAKHQFHKMDSLAVPELSAGAMENWGLVIYKENQLLYNEDSNSTIQEETVVTIMAHELAHQWFGNLVTAKWWNDIWLNEGFANYFQYVITNETQPTWRMMEKFVVENMQGDAFVADSKIDSHAMVEKRESNKEVMAAFDTITYSKSGSIIRMISYILGEEKFKTALRSYLKTWEFKSATSDDLFTEFEKVGKNIANLKNILKNWVNTPGYPVVNVIRDYKNENATITQSRFLDTINSTSSETYWVPINYVTEDNLNFEVDVPRWLEPSKSSLSIDIPEKKNQFVLFNKQQFGYYRVNYDVENWEMISRYLRNSSKDYTKIHVLNRAQLIDDALNLAKVNKLEYAIALTLTEYLKKEKDLMPWVAAWRGFGHLSKVVANTKFASKFREYVVQLSEHLAQEVLSIKSNETDHIMQLKKIETLIPACTFGSNACRSRATEMLTKWLDEPKKHSLLGDDEKWVICGGVRNASPVTWNKLYSKYLEELNDDILIALGCTSNIEILQGFITRVIHENRTEDLSAVFRSIYTGSDEGINVVLDYLIKHYKALKLYPGYDKNQLELDFTSLGQRLTNEKQHQMLIKFQMDADSASKDLVAEALKSVENNLKEMKWRSIQFNVYFKETAPPTTTPAPTQPGSATVSTLSTIVILASIFIIQIY